ncbi:MAG TPA: glycosyltransferase family 4 protein [Tepidisphaeraceae bacterium]|nr:glycosyltransferase family 4 protein [Tepidisphaeraceae bacterium]
MGRKPLRIFYAAGPGDVIGTFGHWSAGRDDPSQVAVTYSGQFYDACRDLGAEGYVLAYNPNKRSVREGPFRIVHRPLRFMRGPGPLYHLEQIWAGARMALSAKRFGADVAIVSGGAHWFSLGLMARLGVRVVPTLHCVLWSKHAPPERYRKWPWRWDARFFAARPAAVMSLSDDITEQLGVMAAGRYGRPVFPFLPTYRREAFAGMPPPPAGKPFRVLFAGRIEPNKGVYDLLAIAKRFAAAGRTDVEFDLCGDGGHLAALRTAADAAGVSPRFRCHGHVTKPVMRQRFEQCHVLIAPTTTDFIEGFNKTVAEGVLAGRPVVTSSVCPALAYVREAVVEVPPDDVSAYGDAILRLCDDPRLYEQKRRGCGDVAELFYDPERGWAAALKRVIAHLGLVPVEGPSVTEAELRATEVRGVA